VRSTRLLGTFAQEPDFRYTALPEGNLSTTRRLATCAVALTKTAAPLRDSRAGPPAATAARAAGTPEMRTDRGLPSLPHEAYRPMAGAGARGMLGVAFGMTPDHPEFAVMREEFFVNYERRMTVLTRAFDGIHEMVEAIVGRGLAWGVVTRRPKASGNNLVRVS
jgi:phosphoglycolate phosphatase-like HAD superfamily hydrolase